MGPTYVSPKRRSVLEVVHWVLTPLVVFVFSLLLHGADEPVDPFGPAPLVVASVVVIGLLLALIGLLAWLAVRPDWKPRRHEGLWLIVIMLALWAAGPCLATFTLLDGEQSARDWLATSWYWTVNPIPLDVHEPFNWVPAVSELEGIQATVMVVLQAYTLFLLFWALRFGWKIIRQPEPEARPGS